MVEPEPSLWEAAQRGEPDALEALMDACLPVVVEWCHRLGGPKVDPEDAAHDVLLVVLAKVDRVRDRRRFEAWLYGVTRRVLGKHRTRAWVRRWRPGAEVERVDRDRPDAVELAHLATLVWSLLDRASDLDREILVLCDLEGRTDAEAAAVLGISRHTVRSRLHRARKRFRALAEAEGLLPELTDVIDGGSP